MTNTVFASTWVRSRSPIESTHSFITPTDEVLAVVKYNMINGVIAVIDDANNGSYKITLQSKPKHDTENSALTRADTMIGDDNHVLKKLMDAAFSDDDYEKYDPYQGKRRNTVSMPFGMMIPPQIRAQIALVDDRANTIIEKIKTGIQNTYFQKLYDTGQRANVDDLISDLKLRKYSGQLTLEQSKDYYSRTKYQLGRGFLEVATLDETLAGRVVYYTPELMAHEKVIPFVTRKQYIEFLSRYDQSRDGVLTESASKLIEKFGLTDAEMGELLLHRPVLLPMIMKLMPVPESILVEVFKGHPSVFHSIDATLEQFQLFVSANSVNYTLKVLKDFKSEWLEWLNTELQKHRGSLLYAADDHAKVKKLMKSPLTQQA
jgi:hypothetical protein